MRMFSVGLGRREAQLDFPGMDFGAGEKDMVDVMREIGFLRQPEGRLELVQTVARHGTLELMTYVIESGAVPVGSLLKGDLCRVLACATGGSRQFGCEDADKVEMVRFLLDVKGEDGAKVFDPNVVNYGRVKTLKEKNLLALHEAIRGGNKDVVRLLLERGAKMVGDYHGVGPLDLAEQQKNKYGRVWEEIVQLLEAWLEERGLPSGHVDEPSVLEEEEEAPAAYKAGKNTGMRP